MSFRWDYIELGGKILKDMDRLAAFREGLTTWSRWVDSNVDANKTKVFFQGISPTHYKYVSSTFLLPLKCLKTKVCHFHFRQFLSQHFIFKLINFFFTLEGIEPLDLP